MKITKKQLRRIIKEEKRNILNESPARKPSITPATHTIFNSDAIRDLLEAEVQDYLTQEYGPSAWQEGNTLDGYEVKHLKHAVQQALEKLLRSV